MSWLSDYAALCGDLSHLGKLVLLGDLGIALAYFAIPLGILVVWHRRLKDLPYPWILCLFAAFIVGCGLTHLVHAIQMPYTTFAHTVVEATVKTITAVLSIGTAAALSFIIPKILKLVSPKVRQQELEALVAERTKENEGLLKEIGHQLGNQLQIMHSVLRIERRKAKTEDEFAMLTRVDSAVEELSHRYRVWNKLHPRDQFYDREAS